MTIDKNKVHEKQISDFRNFYTLHFTSLINKAQARKEFAQQYSQFKSHNEEEVRDLIPAFDKETSKLIRDGEDLIGKYLGEKGVELYNKELTFDRSNSETPSMTDNIWANIFIALGDGLSKVREKYQRQYKYKMDLIKYCYLCLHHQGLHPLIEERAEECKRFNLSVSYYSGDSERSVYRILMTFDQLSSVFLKPFHEEKRVVIKGQIIQPKALAEIKITSTKLNKFEIPLFAEKNGIDWEEGKKDEFDFLHACKDETDEVLLDKDLSSLVNATSLFKNNQAHYIYPDRIQEIAAIDNSEVDLSRLVQLCRELNSNAQNASWLSVLSNLRAIIDHVPPIFGFKTFRQAVSNHQWDKSVKSSLKYLEESSRSISDHSVHAQAKKVDAVPNRTQADFSNSLDVLLCEVIKHLKK